MDDQNSAQGPYDFQVYWSRRWAVFIVLACAGIMALVAGMSIMAWPAHPAGAAAGLAFAVVLAYGVTRGVRLFRHPPLMFEFQPSGIVSYYRNHAYSQDAFELPWREVESLELVEREGGEGNRLHLWTLAVKVRRPEGVPADRSVGGGDPQTLHLDANTGSLRRTALVRKARAAMAAFAKR